jgi:phosphinothricin acetyltransferase
MQKHSFEIRQAEVKDAADVGSIYNQGIDERTATFNTEHVTEKDMREKIKKGDDGKHPVYVATLKDSGEVVGWISVSEYSPRKCYSGIGEVSLYIKKGYRGQGIGKALFKFLIEAAKHQGYWKLMGRIFLTNQASRRLCKDLGFKEIGIHEKHGKLDGRWLDVVEVERLIPENII